MRSISILAMVMACAACQPYPGQAVDGMAPVASGQAAAGINPQPFTNPPSCSSYTVPVIVGGRPQQAVVEACPQADGSWRITQNTPGLPTQIYEVPPPPYSIYPGNYSYAELDFSPYWADTPWFFGLAPSIVVVQNFRRFPHRFGHGFPRCFHRGFGRGFGHGFAAAHAGGGHH